MLDETYKQHKYFMTGIDLSHLVIIDTIDNKIVIYNRNKDINKYVLATYLNMYPDLNINCPDINSKHKINILRKDIFNETPYYTIYKFNRVFIPDIVSNMYINIINNKTYYECDYNIKPDIKGIFILVDIGNKQYICINDGVCFITIPDNEILCNVNINYDLKDDIYPYAYSQNYGYNLYNMTYFDIKYVSTVSPIKFTLDGMKHLVSIKRGFLKTKKKYKEIKPYHIIHKYL